ncbi:MAG: hypothetical protein AAFU03_08140 [Bacteroidota bacterium]
MFDRQPSQRTPFSGIIGIIIAIVGLYLLFQVVRFVFNILWFAAPFIFIASLIVDSKVFMKFVNNIAGLFKRNWIYGVVAGGLSIALFPLTSLYLLGTALFNKRLEEAQKEAYNQTHGELIDYEEVESETMELEIPEEDLPPPPAPQKKVDGKYDSLFE